MKRRRLLSMIRHAFWLMKRETQPSQHIRRGKLFLMWIDAKLRTDPFLPFSMATIIIFFVALISFLLLQNNLSNSISFGVTVAGTFLAVIIFRIQSYPELTYELEISSDLSSRYKMFTFTLLIHQKGLSDFKGEIVIGGPDFLLLENVFYDQSKIEDEDDPLPPENDGGYRVFDKGVRREKGRRLKFETYTEIGYYQIFNQEAVLDWTPPSICLYERPKGLLRKYILPEKEFEFSGGDIQDILHSLLDDARENEESSYIMPASRGWLSTHDYDVMTISLRNFMKLE